MNEERLFQCPVCKLHYQSKELAKHCEAFCRKFHGCSLEITRKSFEHHKFLTQQKQKETNNEN